MWANLLRRVQLLTGLSILVWVTFVTATRNFFMSLLGYVAPSQGEQTGILGSSYQVMRERLRASLLEIEEKNRQLEESRLELVRSRDFLQTVIDSIDDELIVLDRQFCIAAANRTVRLKHASEDVIGRHCYEVNHGLTAPCGPEWKCPIAEVWQTGAPGRATHIHRGKQGDGAGDRHIEVTASPVYDGSGKISRLVVLSRDVTASKEQEERIIEANQQLLALNTIASTVSQSLSLDFILNSALDKALELLRATIGGILLLDENSKTLSYRVYRGLSERYVQEIGDLATGEGIAGRVAKEGETLAVDDISRHPHAARQPVVAGEGLKAFIAAPLKSKERVVGVLAIASREPRPFSRQEAQLLTAMGHQLGIAIENAQLYQELQQKERARADLLRQIFSIQEDERRRVARELHDVTSQALATIGVNLQSLMTILGPGSRDIERQVGEIRSMLDATSRDVHRLIYDLRPSLLDDLGLPAALRSCAHNILDAARVEVHVEVVGPERKAPPEVEIAVFRIVQEAVANVTSHARAESVYISLEFKGEGISVHIEDDGAGFDLPEALSLAHVRHSAGLLGMKERAELLGGTLRIDTAPGKGTKVAVEIPVKWSESDG